MLEVVCAICIREDKVLLARRREEMSMGGLWEFPGGKVGAGEPPEAALQREILEEFSVQARVGKHIATHVHAYPDFTIQLAAYAVTLPSMPLILSDHVCVAWVTPSEAAGFDIAPADIPILESVSKAWPLSPSST